MVCNACNKTSNLTENEDCFTKALDVIKTHFVYYKNALKQRDAEFQRVKERNEKLNKALKLLQTNQQPPTKRFKSQGNDSWLGNNSSQEDRVSSETSLTDDEPMGATNLNMALNSEQLFDTSALSQTKNDVNMASFSEIVQTPYDKESPKRNKQRDAKHCLKDRNNKNTLERVNSEWHTKERCSPLEKSWATKFLQPTKAKASEEKISEERKKTSDKKMSLSLKKTNPAKIKQSLITFNKTKDQSSFRETEVEEDIIDSSLLVVSKNSKAGRSWTHRSGLNYNSSSNNNIHNETATKANTNKSLDDIVFDFSPSKKADSTLDLNFSSKTLEPKCLKFDSDSSKDCLSQQNESLGSSTNKCETSSVVILTPGSQDIIFVDDTEVDTMDLLADIMTPSNKDSLEKLKKYESKCIQNQQIKNKETDLFKKPTNTSQNVANIDSLAKIKLEKNTQENVHEQKHKNKDEEEKPSCSDCNSHIKIIKLPKNPLLATDEQDAEDDEDFMPKPFIIKQESKSSKPEKVLTIKQRFNIDCEECEKLINFLDGRLTDAQIQQHLDKCKLHNNPEFMRLNTPPDFWNPFILSFQADDPRNEVLIDNRFKDNNN